MISIDLLVSARTEQDLLIEMVRMCIAEAGYDPGSIQQIPSGDVRLREGFTFTCLDPRVPHEVCWKARELVGVGEPKCFRCTLADCHPPRPTESCRASERLELDCGVAASHDHDLGDGPGSVVDLADSRAGRR